ncbi:MAG TPA: tetratricopeptide repeat protein [Pyrinomonadaceae bacterium]|nr:tetratricopeptide repeat protein [Pyrinomonadaceae bacterium]
MNCIKGRIVPAVLLLGPVLTFTAPVQAQNSVTASARPAISVLDSTKEQDGLVGSVRRVKTETARIEIKDGHPIEGPAQLVEVTTYGIKGHRIENTSYPIAGSLAGKEEYKYDERGNITEMTLRDDRGAILSREAYTYEFDKFGNWTKMTTNLVVFENGELKREPTEVTYRTVTYYFDDSVAKAVEEPPKPVEPPKSVSVPEPVLREVEETQILGIEYGEISFSTPEIGSIPPPLVLKRIEPALSVAPTAPTLSPAMDLYATGRSRFEAGDVKGAIDAYLQSIKMDPGSAEVFLNLGHAYLKVQKDGDAIKAFKQSLKLNPDQPETQYGLGLASFRQGQFQQAVDAFKKAVTLEPRMAKAHYGLTLAYQELGQSQGVIEHYRILERLDKNLARKVAMTFPQYNFSCRQVQGCP